jgi:hypothetical protein|tara:strand:- start:220 stop:3660 length:3441 start_codon:yes stop_codon:yes gene_type:complete
MATLTLKDLMDPLTKIQAATEETAKTLGAIDLYIQKGGGGMSSKKSTKAEAGAADLQILGVYMSILEKLDTISVSSRKTELLNNAKSGSLYQLRELYEQGKQGLFNWAKTWYFRRKRFRHDMRIDALQSRYLKQIAAGGKMGVVKKKESAIPKKGTKGKGADATALQALFMLGSGVVNLARGLRIYQKIKKGTVASLKKSIDSLFKVLEKFGTPKVKKGVNSLILLGSAIKKFAFALFAAAILLPIGKLGIKMVQAAIKAITPTFIKLGKNSKKINKGAKSLYVMGTSLLSFAKGLALAGLAAIVGLIGIPFLLVAMVTLGAGVAFLGKFDKTIKKGAKSLGVLGRSLKSFAKGLLIASLVSLVVRVTGGVKFMVIAMVTLGIGMALLGKMSKAIRKGARTLDKMGDALKSFALGLAFFALVALFVVTSPILMLAMVLSIVLIGGAIAFLGSKKIGKSIKKGVLNLVLISLGVMVFGFAYAIFAKAFPKNVTFVDIIKQALTIVLIGGAVGLIGKFGLGTMLVGALAVAVIGLSLIVFSFGYVPYAKATKGLKWKDVGIQLALLAGFGLVMGVAGAGPIPAFIILGAIAFAAVGLSLKAFGFGYTPFGEAMKGVTMKDVTTQLALLTGIGLVMGVAGVASVVIGLGALAFGAVGLALQELGPGLKAMKDVKFTKDDSKNLMYTLGAVSWAFTGINEDTGLIAGVKAAAKTTATAVVMTAAAVGYTAAGVALQQVAKGLKAFKDLKFNVEDSRDLALALGSISAAFAQAGGEPANPGGLFGAVFGTAMSPNATEKGIAAVQGAGSALTGIAEGLTSFVGFVKAKINFAEVGENIAKTVGFVQEAFAAVADQGTVQKSGFWGGLLGIQQSKVQEGIDSVQGAGTALIDIAAGVDAFVGIKNPAKTAEKIKTTLGLVGQAFASIGGQEEADGNWLISWDENLVQKGIESVEGAGDALRDIASGLAAFAGKFDPVRVADAVSILLTSIGTTFSKLYKTNARISHQLRDFSSFVVTLGEVARRGELDKAAAGITKIAESINKIDVEKTVAFGDLFKSAAALSKDGKAYFALIKAIDDIKDLMQQQPNLIAQAVQYLSPAAEKEKIQKEQDRAGRGTQYIALNKTLSSLSLAITELPTTLASMELVVTDPNR